VYSITATLTWRRRPAAGTCAPALLVTCVQGGAGCLALIRLATRSCADMAPPYLLLAALEGLAAAFQVERIVGVGNTRQLAKANGAVLFDYDRFWTSLGATPTADGFYLFAPRLPERPLCAIPSRRRRRELRRRELKRSVAATAAARLRQADAAAPPSPC
jgi:uncharacterized protein VirK/YbjX